MSETVSLDRLQARFGLPGALRFEEGPNGLIRAVVTAAAAEAHVYLHGGHVTHYQPRGQAPVLFMSRQSLFAPGKAIRGGVPIIFPWFGARAGDPSAPQHGFARVAAFDVESTRRDDDGSVSVVLRLEPTEALRRVWPHAFAVRYAVRVGAALDLAFGTHNLSDGPLLFEEALHTYLAVSDVREVSVAGLAGTTYIDKTDGMTRKVEGPAPVRLTAETDRVYLDTRATCVVDDPRGGRRLVVDKQGSASTVVWSPWMAKAQAMADLGDDEWTALLCIETANAADDAVTLAPGATHTMRAVIRAEAR